MRHPGYLARNGRSGDGVSVDREVFEQPRPRTGDRLTEQLRRAIVTLGYAGWEAGQLEQEVMDNAWLTIPADERIVFDTPIDERWIAAARKLGVHDPSQLAGYAGHA